MTVHIPDDLLDRATPEQRTLYVRYLIREALATDRPENWLRALFPQHLGAPFAAHHERFWEWAWAIEPAVKPAPFVGVWPRGGAKSTSAELACVLLGARERRRYGIYICATQEQANDHVQTIAGILEAPRVQDAFPVFASRLIGKYGSSKGWRRNRLRTATGFTIDALGLDVAARGAKLDEQRPDFMVFDDLDETEDSLDTIARKERELTRKLLPAGAPDLAVLAIQNLVHPHGIFARLANLTDEPADYLADRIVSGPIPAVEGLEVETVGGRHRIVAGQPTWAGQSVEVCEAQIQEWGLAPFRVEAQHEVDLFTGGMFGIIDFDAEGRRCDPDQVPVLDRVEVWVDPAVTNKDTSDSQAIQADGIGRDGTIYRLRSWERRGSPLEVLTLAITWAFELGAMRVGVETDQGGDTWQSVFREAMSLVLVTRPEFGGKVAPFFDEDKAGAGHGPKAHRAQQMLFDYERPGRIVHVRGTHQILEAALRRFLIAKPFDLTDAAYWSWHGLREIGQGDLPGARQLLDQAVGPMARSGRLEFQRSVR